MEKEVLYGEIGDSREENTVTTRTRLITKFRRNIYITI